MPNGTDPLPNTLVYVPNAPLEPMPEGVHGCQHCSTLITGSPLVSAVTDYAGHFTITNMPVGTQIPLVIQNGKWRRQFVLPNVAPCIDTVVSQKLKMPAHQSEGDMPKIAIVTGGFAALECILLKTGVSLQEFGSGSPTSNRRVQLYKSDGNPGAQYDDATPLESALWGTQTSLNKYDLVFFGCQGSRFPRTPVAKQTVLNYANAGGQLMLNHAAFEWMYNVQPISATANWSIGQPTTFGTGANPANIDTSFPKGQMLAQWISLLHPGTVPGQLSLNLLYADLTAVVPPSRLWMSAPDTLHSVPVPMQYTFETPLGLPPSQQCGRVMFNEFHTIEHFPYGLTFPAECSNSPLRADERVMQFMIFDQGSCR